MVTSNQRSLVYSAMAAISCTGMNREPLRAVATPLGSARYFVKASMRRNCLKGSVLAATEDKCIYRIHRTGG